MADKKISQLTAATTPLAGTEVLPIVQSGSTVKVSVDNLTAGKAVSMSSATISGGMSSDTDTLFVNSSTRRVGIGTTNPGYKLTVAGSAGAATVSLLESGVRSWGIRAGGDATNTLDIADFTAGASRLLIDSSGNVKVRSNNVIFETAAKGIDFSANTHAAGMTSELLNWYEEGTWTPDLKFGGANTGITYSSRSGTYTRIGRMVHARATIVLSSNGSASGGATVTGLPFNCAVTTTASIYQDGIAYTGSLNVAVEGTVDRFTIQQVSEAGVNSNLARTSFSNTASFTLSVCYQV